MPERERHEELREELRAQFDEVKAQFEATNAKIEQKAGRNIFLAVASGLTFAVVFLVALFTAEWAFVCLVAVLAVVASLELATAFQRFGLRLPRILLLCLGCAVVAGATWFGALGLLVACLAACVVVGLWSVVAGALRAAQKASARTVWYQVCAGTFVLVYVPFFASMAILLYHQPRGEWWVFALVLLVACTDIGAYAAGVLLGRHKMTPRISPNKTWEGFIGAAVAAVLAGIVIALLELQQPWWVGVLLGLVVLCTASGGDLIESLIKRNLGVKDMSTWFPGHGGFLDRLDSLLPSAVGVYGVSLILGVAV